MTVWLFTFLVHSTLWCGAAWLGLRAFPGTHARARETIWYTALAASLITPTIHSATRPDSAVWRLPMPAVVAGGEHESDEKPGHKSGAASVPMPAGEEAHRQEDAATASWPPAAGILWFVLAGGLLALYLFRLEKLRRRLRDREPVTDPRASRALAALGGRAALVRPPRLTESHNLGSPVALGVGTSREICVPVRALHELREGELRALLGHEVAHHLRHDTIRLAILQVVQAVFFFQPLVRLAVRDLRLAAEEMCDDWAADQSGDRFAMASCLTQVARWVVRGDRHTPVPCIGRRRSQLERRVLRLVNDDRSLRAPSRHWRRMSAVSLLALTPLFAPKVAPWADASHEHRSATVGALPREHEQPREHEVPREHEFRERREHGPARPAQSAPPVREGEMRGAGTTLPDAERDGM